MDAGELLQHHQNELTYLRVAAGARWDQCKELQAKLDRSEATIAILGRAVGEEQSWRQRVGDRRVDLLKAHREIEVLRQLLADWCEGR